MDRREFLRSVGACATALGLPGWCSAVESESKLPNIVYILCDDLGYGDIKHLNPEGKIATPNVDKLATGGMTFTDAHSGSSVCTPTRYGILTGRYCWRTKLQKGVLWGYSPPLIAADRMTVASLLKSSGYATACIGKWHLGMGVPKDPAEMEVTMGPTTCGFDGFYGISASLDMPPFAFIEDDHFVEAPTATKRWVRSGSAAPSFEAVDVLPTLARKAADYIDSRAADAKAGTPFFLYLPLASPHTPIVPSKEWEGRSSLGKYGDFVMQTDWAVGEVMKALERNGLDEDTLVVFTSDNGCSPAAGIQALESGGHYPNYIYRGHKADIWDGGHRIPFICRWPARIAAGASSAQLVCLTDLMATCADIAGSAMPAEAGEDSVSILPALLGHAKQPLREAVVHHSIAGKFSIRQGRWKLELCSGSGGWSAPKDKDALKQGLPSIQLYDMKADPTEQQNISADHPEVVANLTRLLEAYVVNGRSTPGVPQPNDVAVDILKEG